MNCHEWIFGRKIWTSVDCRSFGRRSFQMHQEIMRRHPLSTAWQFFFPTQDKKTHVFPLSRKKWCFFFQSISRNTLKTHFCSKKIIFLLWILMDSSSANSHLPQKLKALEVNPPVSRENFQISRCYSKSFHLFAAWWTVVEAEGRTVRVDACPGLVTLVENLKTSTETTKLEEIIWTTKSLRTSEWHLVQWTRREWQIFFSWCKFYDSATLQRHMWHWYQHLPLSETYHNSPCHRLHSYTKPMR